MIFRILTISMAALLFTGIATAQTKMRPSDFDVSDGRIEQAAGDRLIVESKEMRATLKKVSSAQRATVNFTYLGPTREVSHLGNGDVRHQFGIKLKAQDICNLVYVMWNFDTQKIAVSVKLNPGQRTHEDCLDRGYINNIKPVVSAAPPAIRVDRPHTLYADLRGQQLTVKADGVLVWDGTLVPVVLRFNGPLGLRSDNAHVVFDFLAEPGPSAQAVSKVIYVAASRKACMGNVPAMCLQTRTKATDPWGLFYDEIVGFTPKPGVEYRLRILEDPVRNPPMDAPSTREYLDAILSERVVAKGKQ